MKPKRKPSPAAERRLIRSRMKLPDIVVGTLRFRPVIDEKTELRDVAMAYLTWGIHLSFNFIPKPRPKED